MAYHCPSRLGTSISRFCRESRTAWTSSARRSWSREVATSVRGRPRSPGMRRKSRVAAGVKRWMRSRVSRIRVPMSVAASRLLMSSWVSISSSFFFFSSALTVSSSSLVDCSSSREVSSSSLVDCSSSLFACSSSLADCSSSLAVSSSSMVACRSWRVEKRSRCSSSIRPSPSASRPSAGSAAWAVKVTSRCPGPAAGSGLAATSTRRPPLAEPRAQPLPAHPAALLPGPAEDLRQRLGQLAARQLDDLETRLAARRRQESAGVAVKKGHPVFRIEQDARRRVFFHE